MSMSAEFDPTNYTTKDLFYKLGIDEVRQILLDYGVTKPVMNMFGDSDKLCYSDLELEAIKAAETFADLGLNDFSITHLTMLLFHDDWVPYHTKRFKTRLVNRLSAMYVDEAQSRSRDYRMDIPCIQILRERTGNYSGNVYEARTHWKGFIPSDTDLRRSTRIPVPVSGGTYRMASRDAFVLGVIYAAGFLSKPSHLSHPVSLFVRGDKGDLPFYRDIAATLFSEVFNMQNIYVEEERPVRDRTGTYILPFFRLSSKAVSTWLRYDLDFPAEGTHNETKCIPVPKIDERNITDFVSGFVSAKGTRHEHRGSMRFISRHVNLLKGLRSVLASLGIPVSGPYESRSGPFLEVVKSNLGLLCAKLDIRNPKLRTS